MWQQVLHAEEACRLAKVAARDCQLQSYPVSPQDAASVSRQAAGRLRK
jgi:hypothetical protein